MNFQLAWWFPLTLKKKKGIPTCCKDKAGESKQKRMEHQISKHMDLTATKCAFIKCAVICLLLISSFFVVRIIYILSITSQWIYRANVDYAVLTALHPGANFSSTTSSIQYQLTLNVTFETAIGGTGYRDCSATAWYKDTMLDAPKDWIPDQGKDPIKELVSRFHSFISSLRTRIHINIYYKYI